MYIKALVGDSLKMASRKPKHCSCYVRLIAGPSGRAV